MSTKRTIGKEGSVDEQTNEHETEWGRGDVEEGPEQRASVEQDIQAKVDYADDREIEGRLFGQTLVAQEKREAREVEINRTRDRWDRRADSDREARTRRVVEDGCAERRREFERRAASVDPRCDPDVADPRARLSREQLGLVNEQSKRLEAKLDGWSRAAISRRLAERVVDGSDVLSAVVGVFEELEQAAGTIIPIAAVEEVDRGEVCVEGTVKVLWKATHPKISQVGLIEDDSGVCKVTVWKASEQPVMEEGERVRLRGAAKSWYDGRVSLALTGWSEIDFPGR
ncbi:DNA-binding protein [Natronoarchaeum sp. GCM10025321]|uniref:DNA-binding protein n=1 Tax=Natronoarchaeum sp. GCM10025321 TaxID=3252684 RepID=UPI0036230FB9